MMKCKRIDQGMKNTMILIYVLTAIMYADSEMNFLSNHVWQIPCFLKEKKDLLTTPMFPSNSCFA